MLIAAGGGGAGGTPWGLMTMQDMQAYIQNPDTDQHYKLLTGWKRSADLINEHRWQVENYRDNLAAAWPPEKNAAAEAYITRLNELIANLEETYEAAIANHDAFASATLSISLAQREMDELAREYSANEQALAAYSAKPPTPSGQPSPTPSPSPSGEQPPVAPGRQEELHRKAVELLNGVSADLAQAQVKIQTPRPYRQGDGLDDPPAGDSGGYVPPPIPPITPSYGAESTARPTGPSGSAAPFPTSPNVPLPTTPQPTAPQPGLVLGGATPTTLNPPTTGLTPVAPPIAGGTAPLPGPGLLPTVPTGFAPNGTNLLVPPANGPLGRSTGLPREGFIRPGTPAPGGMHVMPPGGMIGGAPGIGMAQPSGARPGAQRINPIGGVIGGGPPGNRTGSANTVSHQGGAVGPYGCSRGRDVGRRDADDKTHWDPNNPWETATGVDPVVTPPRTQRIDPGPAIGLT